MGAHPTALVRLLPRNGWAAAVPPPKLGSPTGPHISLPAGTHPPQRRRCLGRRGTCWRRSWRSSTSRVRPLWCLWWGGRAETGAPTSGHPNQPAWCTKFLEDSFPLPSLPGYRTAGQGGYTPAAAAPTQTGGAGGQGRAPRADERQRILSCRHTRHGAARHCLHFMHCITCGDIQKDCGGPCCCTGVRDIQCAEAEGAHTKGPGARVQKAGRGDC